MLKGIHVVNLRLCIPYSGCALPLNVRAIMALHTTSPEQHKRLCLKKKHKKTQKHPQQQQIQKK